MLYREYYMIVWRCEFYLRVLVIFLTSGRSKRVRNTFIFKCINGLIYFNFKLITNNNIHTHNTRTSKNLHLPKANTNRGKRKPIYQASNDFNNLDNTIKNTDSKLKKETKL